MSLGRITVDLLARTGSFISDTNRAAKHSAKRAKEIDAAFSKAGKAIGVALVAGASAAAVALKSSIDRMDELSKSAQKIGVTTEAISRLAYAATLSDVSIEQLQGGLAKLVKYQAEAAQGGKEAAATFKAFGIAIKDSAGSLRGTEAVLQDFAKVFALLPDGPEKTALALRVFGKAGAELIPLLNSGAQGLADMAAESDRLGNTITTKAGKEAEAFNDNLTRLQTQVLGLANSVALELVGDLERLSAEFVKSSTAGGGMAETAKTIANSIRFVVSAGQAGIDVIQGFTSSIQALGAKSAQLLSALPIGKLLGGDQDFLRELAEVAKNDAVSQIQQAKNRFSPATGAAAGGTQAGGNPRGRGAATGRADGLTDKTARLAAEAARGLLATDTRETKANTEAKAEQSEAARRAAEAQDELNRKVEAAIDASQQFNATLEDLTAQLGGPLAESALRYRREEEELRALWAEGSTPAAEDLTKALDALHIARDADAETIRKSLDPAGQRLLQMQSELDLINLQTQAARDKAAFMLDNPGATNAQGDAAASLLAQLDATQKQIAAADQMRGGFEDAFASILDGSKSAKEAFNDLTQSVLANIAQVLAKKLTESLFGGFGTTGAGSPGGGILSALFNLPGFANGTNSAPGGMAVVGERGPEIVNLPKGSSVTPNHKLGTGDVNFGGLHFHGQVTKETAQQAANVIARKIAFAGRG